MEKPKEKITIHEVLKRGVINAITGRQLAAIFGVNLRAVTRMIRQERLEGIPICASHTEGVWGYYLPRSDEELKGYLNQLDHAIEETAKMRDAVANGQEVTEKVVIV